MAAILGRQWAFVAWILATAIVSDAAKPTPVKHQEIILEDGTRCVVLKGLYSDNAITCDWKGVQNERYMGNQ